MMITFPTLASQHQRRYGSPVTVNPVAGFGDPIISRRTSAPCPIAGAFFCVRRFELWRLCVGGRKVCRVPTVPVRQPAYSCHP